MLLFPFNITMTTIKFIVMLSFRPFFQGIVIILTVLILILVVCSYSLQVG